MSRGEGEDKSANAVLAGFALREASIALMIATAMQAFDATMVNVALPRLEATFGQSIALGSWVMTSYLCAAAVTAPLTGWLRRRYGARQILAGAIFLFVSASLFCAVAPSAQILILGRFFQGGAAGLIQPLAQATLLDIHPKREHGRVLAFWGATIMTGPVLGPALGGVLTDLASWRWIFAINLPLGLLAAAGLRPLPKAIEGPREAGVDLRAIIFLALGVGALQLALERSIGNNPLKSIEIIGEGSIAAFALSAVGLRSLRTQLGIFKFDVFKDVNFCISSFYTFMIGALLFSTIVLLPALVQGPFGRDATTAGLLLAPRGLMTLLTMLFLARVIGRVDHRIFLLIGFVMTAAALELVAGAPQSGAEGWLALSSALLGAGVGLLFTPLSTLAFSTLPEAVRADGAGVYSLLRQLGSATGVAVLAALLQSRIGAHLGSLAPRGAPRFGSSFAPPIAAGTFAAYADCFRWMALATLAIIPGIFIFRVLKGGSEKSGRPQSASSPPP